MTEKVKILDYGSTHTAMVAELDSLNVQRSLITVPNFPVPLRMRRVSFEGSTGLLKEHVLNLALLFGIQREAHHISQADSASKGCMP